MRDSRWMISLLPTSTPPPFPVPCTVLASANPVGSRYNPQLSVVENIQLPPSLMSRFDLIYLLLDKPNEASDRKLAKHLVSLFGDRSNLEAKKVGRQCLDEGLGLRGAVEA